MPKMDRLVTYFTLGTLCYLTLLVLPFTNLTLRKLQLGACIILLTKYICELLMYAKHF